MISVGALPELVGIFGDPLLLENRNISQRSEQFQDAVNAPKTVRPNSAEGSDSDGRDEADSDLNITTPLYSHLGNESVRKVDFYGLTIALTKT